ncbi:hypothetical protein [Tepidimicrobium xylanilyticum]
MKKEKDKNLHKFEIKEGEIILDDFKKFKTIVSYESILLSTYNRVSC